MLSSYNPFSPLPVCDRQLILDLLDLGGVRVALSSPDWEGQVDGALATHGTAELLAPSADRMSLSGAILKVVGRPLCVGALEFYARVSGIERTEEGDLSVLFDVEEALQ